MNDLISVLVVDDEPAFREGLRQALKQEGFIVHLAADGEEALEVYEAYHPDIVLLDVMLPRMSGIDVCRKIRASDDTPVIMVSARNEEIDAVVALEVGADDYVTKPFSIKVLLARVDAVLRRASKEAGASSIVELGPVRIDLDRHEASCAGESIKLTLTEFRLLAALMQAPGRVLSRRGLISNAIGPGITVTERTIDVHVAAIRKKLGEYGSMIQTVRGVGYRINDPDA